MSAKIQVTPLKTNMDTLDPNPQQGDCGITFLEMFVNFRLVTGENLPITLHRKGTRVTWASFNSDQALIQTKRARSAVAQAVVLEYLIQQLSKFTNRKYIPFAKKTGIKTLSHFGHSELQKRTGYVVRPQLKFASETVQVIDAFLTDCRNSHNYNLPLDPKKYCQILPQPLHYEIPFAIKHLNPEQVVYRRKFLHKNKWWSCWASFREIFFWHFAILGCLMDFTQGDGQQFFASLCMGRYTLLAWNNVRIIYVLSVVEF